MQLNHVLWFLLLGLFSALPVQAETGSSIAEEEQKIIALYNSFWYPNTSSYQHQNVLIPEFISRFEKLLANPQSFDYPFTELAKTIKIRWSEDKKLRIFSWDNNTNHDWRNILSIAQYKDEKGKIQTQWLSNGDEQLTGEYTDVWIYGVHQLKLGKHTHYMTIGEGTHGNGQHHLTIQLFELRGDKLVRCGSCFENAGDYLVIRAILLDHFNLMYNAEKQELSYSSFEKDESSGFYIKTGGRTKLRYAGKDGFVVVQ